MAKLNVLGQFTSTLTISEKKLSLLNLSFHKGTCLRVSRGSWYLGSTIQLCISAAAVPRQASLPLRQDSLTTSVLNNLQLSAQNLNEYVKCLVIQVENIKRWYKLWFWNFLILNLHLPQFCISVVAVLVIMLLWLYLQDLTACAMNSFNPLTEDFLKENITKLQERNKY